ncbi:serine/threonine dehydratase [Tistrella bauzanensis]|uniref:Serine/threonine dehydratase n=1 Tax=Tistrella bauzanensis TaxID=657419 RepID=A0ABQ1I9T0_9PROT|nr:threonine dehydratase [Tistrella bauzanensis]GGB23027.1 serine/threonine dehydratase [Tistrella bauzanensis]
MARIGAQAGAEIAALDAAARIVGEAMAPTPQYAWPLLSARLGVETWVKHDNHSPVGAFKLRGALVHVARLVAVLPELTGLVAATRGNHGQAVAFAARRHGLAATIVVPLGNSPDKNAAMRALGAAVVEHGVDYQAARDHAAALIAEAGGRAALVPPVSPDIADGAATQALELFRAAPALDRLYVAVGMGSGICGAVRARDALGLQTRIIGVVAEGAPAYALSFAAGRRITTDTATTFADGIACRAPDPFALDIIARGVDRFVTVPEQQIVAAVRAFHDDTHNLAEGAGAAALAGAMADAAAGRLAGCGRIGVVLSGGNIDAALYAQLIAAQAA